MEGRLSMKKFLIWAAAALLIGGCSTAGNDGPAEGVNDEAFSKLQTQAEAIFETFKPARCPIGSDVIRVKECAIYVELVSDSYATVRQVVSAVAYNFPTLGLDISVVCNYQLDGAGFTWMSGTTSGSLSSSTDDSISPLENGLSQDGTRLCPSTTP
jgi:hypothetical protein